MSKDDSRDPNRSSIGAGVVNDLARAFGVSAPTGEYDDSPLELELQPVAAPAKLVGRGSNRRTREIHDPRFPVHLRAGRAMIRR